jgi:hypothetical protein
MKRLIYLKKGKPSCFAPKERSALKKSRPRYISALKKVVPDISRPKNHLCNRINWVNRIEEQRK